MMPDRLIHKMGVTLIVSLIAAAVKLSMRLNCRDRKQDKGNILYFFNISEGLPIQSKTLKVKGSPDKPGVAQRVPRALGPLILHDIRHMKVVRLSAPRSGCLYLQEILLVFIFTRGLVDLRANVRSEGIYH